MTGNTSVTGKSLWLEVHYFSGQVQCETGYQYFAKAMSYLGYLHQYNMSTAKSSCTGFAVRKW